MLAILAAATVAAAQPAPHGQLDQSGTILVRPAITHVAGAMPNVYQAPAHCGDQRYRVVDRYGRPVLLPLGSLPTPSLQLTVDRRVDGCPVITVARGSPPPVADQPNPPASQFRFQPLRPGE